MFLPLVTLLMVAPVQAADTFAVDAEKSDIHAHIDLNETSLAMSTGHLSHALSLGKMEGTLTLDGDTVTAVKVTGTVASLTSSDAIRTAAGLEGALTDKNMKWLMDCVFNQLQPETDNTITFEGTGFEGSMDELTVTGNFTLHGETQEVTVPMALARDGDSVTATGTLEFDLPDYGFRIPESGEWSVKDDAKATLNLVFTKS